MNQGTTRLALGAFSVLAFALLVAACTPTVSDNGTATPIPTLTEEVVLNVNDVERTMGEMVDRATPTVSDNGTATPISTLTETVVLNVNGVERTMGEMVDRAKALVVSQVEAGVQPKIPNVPFEVLTRLVDEELLIQGAPLLGVTVTRDDVDGEIDTYRQIVRTKTLRSQIREIVGQNVPSLEESVYVHWIWVSDETVASEVVGRLEAGEEFDALAREYNQDTVWADHDGEVGWVPRGAFFELEEALFSIEHGVVSSPLRSRAGVYILKVTDGPEIVEVNDNMKEVLKTRALENWLDEQRESNNIVVNFNSDDYDWVISKIVELTTEVSLTSS